MHVALRLPGPPECQAALPRPPARHPTPVPPLLRPALPVPGCCSAHLKLHPLLVLSALVVAEHSMGVWGLLLAVPMTVFALDYLIK